MPPWLIGAIRTALQVGWGIAATWLLRHHVPVPAPAPEWAQGAVLAVAVGVVTAAVQWAERRGDTPVGRLLRMLARVLMLGARPAAYPRLSG